MYGLVLMENLLEHCYKSNGQKAGSYTETVLPSNDLFYSYLFYYDIFISIYPRVTHIYNL